MGVEVIIALIGVAGTLGAAAIPPLLQRIQRRRNWRTSQKGPHNQVLLLGIGRVGKTQLVKTLANDSEPVSREITKEITIHDVTQNEEYMLIDYRGQEIGQIIDVFDGKTDNRVFKGSVNSLVLIVDLFPPPAAEQNDTYDTTRRKEDEEREMTYGDVSRERIDTNLQTWTTATLDLILRHVPTPALKGICLFINKADKWSNWDRQPQNAEAMEHYRPLIEDLQSRCRASHHVDFIAIVGSTLTGANIIGQDGLLQALKRWCIKEERND